MISKKNLEKRMEQGVKNTKVNKKDRLTITEKKNKEILKSKEIKKQ